jgi:hypothetical protein
VTRHQLADGVETGFLLALAVAAAAAMISVDLAQKAWTWVNRRAELVKRPSGRVVAEFDGAKP